MNKTEHLQVRYRNNRWQDHEPGFELPQNKEVQVKPIDSNVREALKELNHGASTFPPVDNWK